MEEEEDDDDYDKKKVVYVCSPRFAAASRLPATIQPEEERFCGAMSPDVFSVVLFVPKLPSLSSPLIYAGAL